MDMATAGGNEMEEHSVRLSPGHPGFSLNLPIRQPNKHVEKIRLVLKGKKPPSFGEIRNEQ